MYSAKVALPKVPRALSAKYWVKRRGHGEEHDKVLALKGA